MLVEIINWRASDDGYWAFCIKLGSTVDDVIALATSPDAGGDETIGLILHEWIDEQHRIGHYVSHRNQVSKNTINK